MDREDPITQFFPGQETVDLYDVLNVPSDAKSDAIKKAYRRLALVYHPDKHATAGDMDKAAASTKFQQVGFAYAVLIDEKRRLRYDQTGRTDEGFELAAGDDGWEAYFEAMFERVTRGKLDEMKKEYQGDEELEDLVTAYTSTSGSIGDLMNHIPHSTNEDEARFIGIISNLIAKGTLPMLDAWEKSVKDEKAKLVRRKQGEKEAKEAEQLARELGVWDEFYGSGKKGKRKTEERGKKQTDGRDDEEADYSQLQALILKKRQKNMDSFFDGLAEKYAEPPSEAREQAKKRGRVVNEAEVEGLPTKKIRKGASQPPVIDDEEFKKLQTSLFGTETKLPSSTLRSQAKTATKTRKKAK